MMDIEQFSNDVSTQLQTGARILQLQDSPFYIIPQDTRSGVPEWQFRHTEKAAASLLEGELVPADDDLTGHAKTIGFSLKITRFR